MANLEKILIKSINNSLCTVRMCPDIVDRFTKRLIDNKQLDNTLIRFQRMQKYLEELRTHVFLDDIRMPSDKGFSNKMKICRSSDELITHLHKNGCPSFISFDHDLGTKDTAMVVVNFLIEQDLNLNGHFIPYDFSFNVHSDNPVGAENIKCKLNRYLNFRTKT